MKQMKNYTKKNISNYDLGYFVKIPDSVHISYFSLMALAYIYMVIPIIIFVIGWMNAIVASVAIFFLLFGLFELLKNKKVDIERNRILEFDIGGLIIVIAISITWVYMSGVGGFWPQRADWHWRNAILRDLIDYTWPVIYPRTGNALTYYYNYFLLPAVVGKLFGWEMANIALFLMTVIGVIITFLLICQYLNAFSFMRMLSVASIFVIWSGEDAIRINIMPLSGGYQLTSNTELLQWVTNQTIIPWVAMAVFINSRSIKNYVFLGLCVLASAPLPFIGFFCFLAADGIDQLFQKKYSTISIWVKDIISIPNICGLVILFIYGPFFLCNSAATGANGEGGFGFFVPLEQLISIPERRISFLSFLCFNAFIYVIILFATYRKNLLFNVMAISLILMPLFRLGTSYDFGMRAVIPAEFMLTVIITDLLLNRSDKVRLQNVLVIGCLSISAFTLFSDTMGRLRILLSQQNSESNFADRIESFSDKDDSLNFLCRSPYEKLFFKLCSSKDYLEIKKDTEKAELYMNGRERALVEGEYQIHPQKCPHLNISYDKENKFICLQDSGDEAIYIKSAYINAKYELYVNNESEQWIQTIDNSTIIGYGEHIWANFDYPENQMFTIREQDNSYMIFWGEDEQYALTYFDDNSVRWIKYDGTDNQMWDIVHIKE